MLTESYLRNIYDKQAERTLVGGQYAAQNKLYYGSGTWFYFNERFKKSIDLLPSEPGRCLDAGCGTGVYSAYIATFSETLLVSCDVSRNYLLKTKELCGQSGVISHLIHCDTSHLPFKDEAFDTILLLEVLEHVTDYRGTLKEIRRVCRDGGCLVFFSPRH